MLTDTEIVKHLATLVPMVIGKIQKDQDIHALTWLREILSLDKAMIPFDAVCATGVVPTLVEVTRETGCRSCALLQIMSQALVTVTDRIQEAAWILANLACGPSQVAKCLVDAKCVPTALEIVEVRALVSPGD